MTKKRNTGLILLVCGAVAFGFSQYIWSQVGEGQSQVDSAQRSVNQAKGLFSLTPATESVGKGITGHAQKRINAGKAEIASYSQLASILQIGGIVLAVIGGAMLIFGKKKQP